MAGGPEQCLIVAETTAPVVCAKGMSVNPHVDFANCPPLDYLLIPGGQGTRAELKNPAVLDFVKRQAAVAKALLTVCTGSFVLQPAGLLAGKKATTHWGSLQRLRDLGDVEVLEQRYTQDGHIWCSAGVSAGIDMMLAFSAATAAAQAAGKVQFASEYYPDSTSYGDFRNHPQAPTYIRPAR